MIPRPWHRFSLLWLPMNGSTVSSLSLTWPSCYGFSDKATLLICARSMLACGRQGCHNTFLWLALMNISIGWLPAAKHVDFSLVWHMLTTHLLNNPTFHHPLYIRSSHYPGDVWIFWRRTISFYKQGWLVDVAWAQFGRWSPVRKIVKCQWFSASIFRALKRVRVSVVGEVVCVENDYPIESG